MGAVAFSGVGKAREGRLKLVGNQLQSIMVQICLTIEALGACMVAMHLWTASGSRHVTCCMSLGFWRRTSRLLQIANLQGQCFQ